MDDHQLHAEVEVENAEPVVVESAPAPTPPSSRPKLPLILSSKIGNPEFISDPDDLSDAWNLTPGKGGAKVIMIDRDTVVKCGSCVKLGEAEAMHLVAERTTIPTPRLKGAYILGGIGYIIMSYEEGTHLMEYWNNATEDKREHVIAQLKDYITQMRAIKGDFIGSVDYSRCEDGLFDCDYRGLDVEYGPFKDEAAFNEGILEAYKNRFPPEHRAKFPIDPTSPGYNWGWMFAQLVKSLQDHEIVFTHADLNQSNIIVRDDGTVVLIDWGLAGYWPSYWEFYKTTWMGTFRDDFIRQVERFVPPYYMEAFVMRSIFDKMIG